MIMMVMVIIYIRILFISVSITKFTTLLQSRVNYKDKSDKHFFNHL